LSCSTSLVTTERNSYNLCFWYAFLWQNYWQDVLITLRGTRISDYPWHQNIVIQLE